MHFQILNILLISVGCVFPLILLTFIWAFHGFPYPRKGQNIKQRLDEMRKAGFKKLVTDFPYYERESHMRGDHNATIAQGTLISSVIYILGLAFVTLILFLLSLIIQISPKVTYSIYCVILVLFSVFIFPDQFVKYSHLLGRWTDFLTQGDLPFTPAYWGGIISIYTASIILKDFSTFDIKGIIDKFPDILGVNSIYAIPVALFLFIVAVTSGKLPRIKFQNWVYFYLSWIVGMLTTFILGILLLK